MISVIVDEFISYTVIYKIKVNCKKCLKVRLPLLLVWENSDSKFNISRVKYIRYVCIGIWVAQSERGLLFYDFIVALEGTSEEDRKFLFLVDDNQTGRFLLTFTKLLTQVFPSGRICGSFRKQISYKDFNRPYMIFVTYIIS